MFKEKNIIQDHPWIEMAMDDDSIDEAVRFSLDEIRIAQPEDYGMNQVAQETVISKMKDIKGIADTLLSSQRYDFADLVPSKLENKLAVVYAIFDKHEGSTLYVGRTKNLRQRLYNNHLMGPESNARLKKYLVEDPDRPDISTMDVAKQYLIEH